jgi:hypothetical protein
MRHIVAAIVLGLSALCAAAIAAAAPPKEGVSLTVYNQNFAVVRESRTMKLPDKVSTVQFRDVAKQIDPTSVHFKSLTDPDGTTVQEQNYQFDLVNADKLLDRYIDRPLVVVTKQGQRYAGTLMSFDAKQLVIRGDAGLSMVQRPDNVQNVEFSALPEGLLTRPTLLWKVAAAKPGDHLVQVMYQTTGMGWRADYSVVVSADETKMDLDGWVTLTNQCGATFRDAQVKLIAGDVRKIETARRRELQAVDALAEGQRNAAPAFEERAFFEYHMYTLGWPTTVADNEIKQVELLTAAAVPLVKRYVFEPNGKYWHRRYGEGNFYKINVYVEFKNAEASHLGMPLPKGKVRVYKHDGDKGDIEFVGEDQIDHTPRDEKITLYVGDAFDIVGEKTVTDRKQQQRWRQEAVKIELRNHKDQDAAIIVREHLGGPGQWSITAKSQDYKKVDADTIEFEVPVSKNGKAEVTYTVDYRW